VTDAVVFDLDGVLLDSEQLEEELSLPRAQRIPMLASLSARREPLNRR